MTWSKEHDLYSQSSEGLSWAEGADSVGVASGSRLLGESHRETEFFSLVQSIIFSRAIHAQNWEEER